MKKDLGLELLEKFKEQKRYYIRNADDKRIITDHIMYNSLDDELLEIQKKIGRDNKKRIISECKERGIPIPNFKKGRI